MNTPCDSNRAAEVPSLYAQPLVGHFAAEIGSSRHQEYDLQIVRCLSGYGGNLGLLEDEMLLIRQPQRRSSHGTYLCAGRLPFPHSLAD
jgi:hypothetical protein